MKIKPCEISAALSLVVPIFALTASDTVTNIYVQVAAVYREEDAVNPISAYHSALCGGIVNECMNDTFVELCHFVSNNCAEIATDWMAYETNAMVRFTVQSAVSFAGFANQTNFADKVLALYEANTNAVSWDTIKMIYCPDGSSDAESYLDLHYDTPGISNIVNRLRSCAVAVGDCNMARGCDECLSGELKREYLDMKAAGAL